MRNLFFAILVMLCHLTGNAQQNLKAYVSKTDNGLFDIRITAFAINPKDEYKAMFEVWYTGTKDWCRYELVLNRLPYFNNSAKCIFTYQPYEIGSRMKFKLQDGKIIEFKNSKAISYNDYRTREGIYVTNPTYILTKENIGDLLSNPPEKMRIELKEGFLDKSVSGNYFVANLRQSIAIINEVLNSVSYDSDF